MKGNWSVLGCGLLFAVGLGVSGMSQPGKVTGFLDFTGRWDPSLMFVMAGAILVYAAGYRLLKKGKPRFAPTYEIPDARKTDRPLLVGAAIFGLGWGISGFCPGPALMSLGSLQIAPFLFVGGMLLGMSGYDHFGRFN